MNSKSHAMGKITWPLSHVVSIESFVAIPLYRRKITGCGFVDLLSPLPVPHAFNQKQINNYSPLSNEKQQQSIYLLNANACRQLSYKITSTAAT